MSQPAAGPKAKFLRSPAVADPRLQLAVQVTHNSKTDVAAAGRGRQPGISCYSCENDTGRSVNSCKNQFTNYNRVEKVNIEPRGNPAETQQMPAPYTSNTKEPCRTFALTGSCSFGLKCRYLHVTQCKYFESGMCIYGDGCRFAHIRGEGGGVMVAPASAKARSNCIVALAGFPKRP